MRSMILLLSIASSAHFKKSYQNLRMISVICQQNDVFRRHMEILGQVCLLKIVSHTLLCSLQLGVRTGT